MTTTTTKYIVVVESSRELSDEEVQLVLDLWKESSTLIPSFEEEFRVGAETVKRTVLTAPFL